MDYFNLALANQRAAAKANQEASTANQAADQALDGRNKVALAAAGVIGGLRQRIAELEDALAVKTARDAGLCAVISAYVQEHPTSSLNAETAIRFKTRPALKKARQLIFEAAFVKEAVKLGIANPAGRLDD